MSGTPEAVTGEKRHDSPADPAPGTSGPAASGTPARSGSEEPAPSASEKEAAVSGEEAAASETAEEALPEGSGGSETADGDGGSAGAEEDSTSEGDRDGAGATRLSGATALGAAGDAEEPPATQDFPPPEGAGRAASGGAPAPARQWPLISVLALAALGLLTVGVHPFEAAFRVGTIMVGVALAGGAVLRRVVPSVGMLAVRSRFTDMVTYGVLGVAIVLFALMIQPRPWIDIPFLQSVVHSSVP
ncbi:DUF3017 domain-containing protein [Streptomyces sp. DW26H14]|uniref:DUF3017 domain-containing protein n=1 Tax=Streptomyces sp. DW26H14 TaxID=3435395 RepID=UPI00403E124C